MAALTAAKQLQSKHLGEVKRFKMKASTTIHAGGLVMLDSNGLALPAAASASNKGVVGIATHSQVSAASGEFFVEVQEGTYLLGAASIAQANVGASVYASDDQTVDETQGTNEPLAGKLVEYVGATSGWVWVTWKRF
jgi:predicted RecA/RadA family phage recombinase